MRKAPFYVFATVFAIFAIAVPVWALGTGGTEATSAESIASEDEVGKDLFVTNCGVCHIMDRAGTKGVVGPDLDELFAATGAYDARYSRTVQAVECGIGGRMPAGILSGPLAQEVSRFVAQYANRIAEPALVPSDEAETPEAAAC